MIKSLLVSCVLSVVSGSFYPHCPVSSTLEVRNNSFYYYPLDLYGPPDIVEKERNVTTPCKTFDDTAGFGYAADHICPKSASFCPVTKTNVREAIPSSSTHLARSSMCVLNKLLMNRSETVNFYVSGGSVSLGMAADECCNLPECRFTDFNHLTCTWSFHLYLWMNSTFPANIKYVNFAGHGYSSEYASDNLRRLMNEFSIPPFTSKDIVFLDHSVNDNQSGAAYSIAPALENLIRHLYMHSAPRDWPTIVLLDVDPKPQTFYQGFNISDSYKKVANYYDIPVWSFRDMALSEYSRTMQSWYSKYLTFKGNVVGGSHPPWHVHWFMADLFADIMTSEIKEYCEINTPEKQKMYLQNVHMRNRTVYDLPAPLSVSNASTPDCDNEVLDMDYDSIVKHLPVVGSYAMSPAVGGWSLSVDKPGRPGGFIADVDSVRDASVIFTLNMTTKEFVARKGGLQVIVEYLRSYDNGGVAQFKFCNKTIDDYNLYFEGKLDALWLDFQTNKFSLPAKWSPPTTIFPYTMCEDFALLHPTLEMKYLHQTEMERGKMKFKLLSITACVP